jgi:hypothetical protein
MTIKVVPKAACDPESCSKSQPCTVCTLYTREIRPMRRKPEQKFDAAAEQSFELVSVSKEATRKFIFIFQTLKQGRLKIKNHLCMHRKY